MTVIGWVETDTITDYWADAPSDEDALASYLQAAHEQCVEFLPPVDLVPYPDPIPARYVQAQTMQARALFRSNVAGSNDTIGYGQGVTVFPMDWTVKNLLRPKRVGRVL